MSSRSLLLVLVAVVPLAALLAGLASFLLLRSGFGPLAAGLLPFLGLTLVVISLGLILGRAADTRQRRESEKPKDD